MKKKPVTTLNSVRELINNFIDTEVAYYKLSLHDTQANMYDEADNKIYFAPMRLNCLAMKDDKSQIGESTMSDKKKLNEGISITTDTLEDSIALMTILKNYFQPFP